MTPAERSNRLGIKFALGTVWKFDTYRSSSKFSPLTVKVLISAMVAVLFTDSRNTVTQQEQL